MLVFSPLIAIASPSPPPPRPVLCAEILEHAEVLGIDLKEDEDLLWIAREALKAPLPPGWKPWLVHEPGVQSSLTHSHTYTYNTLQPRRAEQRGLLLQL